MSCQRVQEITRSYIDRESVDLIQAAEVECHLEQCEECDLIYRGQITLRSSLQDGSLYYRAPADLKRRITSSLQKVAEPANALTALTSLKLVLGDN